MSNPKNLIFVVEDDNFFLEVVTDDLAENDSYSVKGFSTAEACLENLHERPDLIVLDYYLDKEDANAMNGQEALKKILAINPEMRVIMLSGQDSLGLAGDIIDAGATDYVIKDIDAVKILKKKITRVLGV
jgi:DNA-binding NtrC family response regulator